MEGMTQQTVCRREVYRVGQYVQMRNAEGTTAEICEVKLQGLYYVGQYS